MGLIVAGLIAAGAGTILTMQAGKSAKIDEQAMKKYAKAFAKEEEAKQLIQKKEQQADQSLLKLARRKKGIIETTINDFLEMYKDIQKIHFTEGNGIKELSALSISTASVERLHSMSISCSKPMTDKELIVGSLFRGMGGMWIKQSERDLSAANSQVRASNVAYSQAETIAVIYDGIKDRADRMADLLKKMNAWLVLSIEEAKNTLTRNGLDVKNYSDNDILVIVNCVNWLKATKDIIDTPLFDSEGKLEEASLKAIETGERYIAEINSTIEN